MTTEPSTLKDKWGTTAMTHTVEFFHSRVRELVAERLATSGKSWEKAVVDPELELTREDFERIEQELLDTGYRFEMSAMVSMKEAPDKYRAPAGVGDSGHQETDEQGRVLVGTGQNVFRRPEDVEGIARFVSTVETVMEMLTEGVPPDTIAVIDDSGGTLTAPILEHFTGVICLSGTVRSHLGILTREYGVPCLMAAELDGLKEGDRLQVEYTKPPTDAYAERDDAARARIWRIS